MQRREPPGNPRKEGIMLGIHPGTMVGMYPSWYVHHLHTLGTPSLPPRGLQYTSLVHGQSQLTALEHRVTELNISDG